jgi:hypothetical protein
VQNYFNYFTEIEDHFQKRRGTGLLLSALDWALIETWKDAGIPLQAVLRGIDSAFDRYQQRASKTRKVNSLAYCVQEVLSAAEDMKEAAVGATGETSESGARRGFDPAEIARFLRRNAAELEAAKLPESSGVSARAIAFEAARSLRELADDIEAKTDEGNKAREGEAKQIAGRPSAQLRLEDLERRLTVLEEKLFAVLLAATSDDQVISVRAEADRDLAPYRSKMPAAQIGQLQKQYVHKRLLERYGLPRLSLFYM